MDAASKYAASIIEHTLMARVAKGDHRAFGQLYDQSSTLLFSLALRILDNPEEAEGVLEETYLDVWRKVVRYDVSRGTPIAWLIALTRTRAIDRVRNRNPRSRSQATPSNDRSHGHLVDQPAGQFEAAADQELRSLIRAAFANLSHDQQQAVELSYYGGLPTAEIASRLDQPVETVRTLIRLGMMKLRESLHSSWEQEKSA